MAKYSSSLPLRCMTFHAGLKRAQAGEIALGGALGGELGGEPLDAGQRLEQFRDAVDGEVGDARAAVGAELNQSLGREHFHRLAQRSARYAQLLRQPGFLGLRSRRQLAANDHRPHPRGGALMEAHPFEFGRLSARVRFGFLRHAGLPADVRS
ncbi:hypothetical protein ACVWZV_007319 [Bradyrhizobium sp. GM5.1]